MVSGTSTNKYAQDKMYSYIDDALEMIFKALFWDRHLRRLKVQVVNGTPVLDNLKYIIREYEDIISIFTDEACPVELPRANVAIIPDLEDGSYSRYFMRSEDPSKVFQILPAVNEYVYVVFRTLCKPEVYRKIISGSTIIPESDRPFTYLPNDEIPFDALAIKYLVCQNYMTIKDDNQAATKNFMSMYQARIAKLKSEQMNSTLSYNATSEGGYPGRWW